MRDRQQRPAPARRAGRRDGGSGRDEHRELVIEADSELRRVPVGEWTFDLLERSLSRGAEVRALSPVEYSILAELVSHPAVPVSRERLLDVSHADGTPPLRRSIDTAVMRLRRLVEPVPSEPVYLQTVYGRGYMFLPVGHRPPALM